MNKKLKVLVFIAIFSALSMILTLFRVSIPFLPPFYKLDLSESVILVGGFYLGPLATIVMQILKNVLKIIFSSTNSAFVGDLANLIMGISFCLPAALYYKKHPDLKGVLIGLVIGIISLTITGCLVNYYIVLPLYAQVYNMPLDAIIAMGTKLNSNINSLFNFVILATAPFNLIKGALSSIVAYLLYKHSKSLINNN